MEARTAPFFFFLHHTEEGYYITEGDLGINFVCVTLFLFVGLLHGLGHKLDDYVWVSIISHRFENSKILCVIRPFLFWFVLIMS